MSNGDEPRPGTTASVEKRVERIEDKVDSLDTRVLGIERDVAHSREIVKLQFDALTRGQEAHSKGQEVLGAKFDALVSSLTEAQRQGTAMMGDPTSTPAGRQIVARLDALETVARGADERTRAVEKRVAYIGGGVAAAVVVVQILAPFLRGLLNLPA